MKRDLDDVVRHEEGEGIVVGPVGLMTLSQREEGDAIAGHPHPLPLSRRERGVFRTLLLLITLLVAWMGTPAQAAAQAAKEEKPTVVKLTVRPAGEPRPALRYQFLPRFVDLRPSNAALIYNQTTLLLPSANREDPKDDSMEKIQKWLDVPPDKLPRDEVRKTLDRYKSVLDNLDLATHRERCDWELPFRERNAITILLPELSKLRDFGRVLAVQARLQIAEGRVDDAVRTLQMGYALGRHAAQGQTVIHDLIGAAICQMMSQQAQELIQQPGAPSFYWAFTMLPRPLIDLRTAIEGEANLLNLSFPVIREIDPKRRELAYWQNIVDRLETEITSSFGIQPPKLG
jgi:hypothetical protein